MKGVYSHTRKLKVFKGTYEAVRQSQYLASEAADLSPVAPFTSFNIRAFHDPGGNIIWTLTTRQIVVQINKTVCAWVVSGLYDDGLTTKDDIHNRDAE